MSSWEKTVKLVSFQFNGPRSNIIRTRFPISLPGRYLKFKDTKNVTKQKTALKQKHRRISRCFLDESVSFRLSLHLFNLLAIQFFCFIHMLKFILFIYLFI